MAAAPPTKRPHRPVAGALFVTASGLFFAVMGAVIKQAATELPNVMVVFFRNFAVLMFFLPQLLAGPGKRIGLSTRRFGHHLLRSAAGLSAMYCYFYALSALPLSEAVLLSYASPLLTPIVARIWLKEPYTIRHVLAGLIGFCGILLILRPGFHAFRPAALVALTAAGFASVAMVTVRKMSDTEPAFRIVGWFTVLATLVSAGPAVVQWQTPPASVFLLILALGGVAFAGQFCLTNGYTLAPSAQVGPFTYTTVFFAAIIGNLIWQEVPHPATFAGGALIVVGGIIATRSGARKKAGT